MPVWSSQNVSTHGMSGVSNESEHERAHEGESHACLWSLKSLRFTSKFNVEAMKQTRFVDVQGEFTRPSAGCHIKTLCGGQM